MDQQLKEKIQQAHLQEQQKQNQENEKTALREKERVANIEQKIPEARKWIKDYLFDLIAKQDVIFSKSSGKSKKEIRLYHNDEKSVPYYIPIESVAKAIKEIDGLWVRKEFIEEMYDPNDESHRSVIEEHYEYYVCWK